MKLNETHKKILSVFIEHCLFEPYMEDITQYTFNDGGSVVQYKDIESDVGLKREDAKPYMLELRNEGLIELVTAVRRDDEMTPCGSGYWLTEDGRHWINENMPFKTNQQTP